MYLSCAAVPKRRVQRQADTGQFSACPIRAYICSHQSYNQLRWIEFPCNGISIMFLKSKIESLIRPLNQYRCRVTLIEDAFGIPPPLQIRRVVVTGIGLATPLGLGVKEAWHALLRGDCGIKRLQAEDLPKARLLPWDLHPRRK